MKKNLGYVFYAAMLICVMFVGCDRTIIVNEATHSRLEVEVNESVGTMESADFSSGIISEIVAETTAESTFESTSEYIEMPTTASHEHRFIYNTEKRANCAEEGIKKGRCVDCDFEVRESIPKTEHHSWGEGEVIKAASLAEEGEALYTCKRCPKTKVARIKKTGLVSIAESAEGICEVICDYEIKTTDDYSYKISAYEDNAITIIENIAMEPFTQYMISVDVKTENVVESEGETIPIGANISVNNRRAVGVTGSSDWQTMQLCVTSNSLGIIEISMNLGSLTNKCSGTVWFDNLQVEPLSEYESTETRWKFLVVLLGKTSLNTYDEDLKKQINLSYAMTEEDVKGITKSINDFEKDLTELSEGKVNAEVTIVRSNANINSYRKSGYGYYIDAYEAKNYLDEQKINFACYDHVMFVACSPDIPREYFGLGGMRISGNIGYSFIIYGGETTIPAEYCYRVTETCWPACVYVHEFLHSIENYAIRFGTTVPSIHGADIYGYEDVDGWRTFYGDIMNNRVCHEGNVLGVDPKVWSIPPRLFGYIK